VQVPLNGGRATFTIVWSKRFINMAKQTTIREIQRRCSCSELRSEVGMGGLLRSSGGVSNSLDIDSH